jgi:Uncharacterised nucleotidyltransferase
MGLTARNNARQGDLVAAVLRGSWRTDPPQPEFTVPQLDSIVPQLVGTGAAGLAWRVVSHDAELAASQPGQRLWEAWMLEVGRAGAQRRQLFDVVQRTSAAGLDPLLIKGWSVARHYPGPGLRPSADIDLCLRPEEEAAGRGVVSGMSAALDFDHLEELEGETIEALFDRSIVVELDGLPVRLAGPVDELRILCLHFLKHGGWRPLWLCDIAMLCERSPESAEHASSGAGRVHEYVRAAIGLAHQLLGAEGAGTSPPPRWMVSAVRREWGSPIKIRARGPLAPVLPWRRFLKDLPGRFPNAVAATAATNAPLTGSPRAVVRLAAIGAGCRRHIGKNF